MSEVAVDFGTSNTVLARYNETTGRAETIQVPEISTRMSYRLDADGDVHQVWVIPSMIHFGEKETLIGDQVLSRGLAEHKDTIRWMKPSIAQGITRRKKTAQGHISPAQAGEEFLRLALNFAVPQISLEEDTFTFTVPVEAFENFQDWVWRVAEGLGIRKLRILDEPTACVFGYHGAARHDERFVVFDFGGGTLNVSAVRLDLSGQSDRKAIQLGKAGCDLGGMNIDQWIATDFCARHALNGDARRDLENLILRQAEAVKIELSDPAKDEASMNVLNDLGQVPRVHVTAYRRSCLDCRQGRAGRYAGPDESCLGCLLLAEEFHKRVRETLERCLENAAIKSGMRRSEITRVLVTGGTSLTPAVRGHLEEAFGERVVYDQPFDCVVRGACRGIVEPILQHDYAIVSYNSASRQDEFKPLFKIGTEYPTPDGMVRYWCKGSTEGQTRVGLFIYEVSRMKKRRLDQAMVDDQGRLQTAARVATNYEHICLNPENPTFILADPPIVRERDKKRFLCSFGIDGNRRLLVTAVDHLSGKTVLSKHPVVRL